MTPQLVLWPQKQSGTEEIGMNDQPLGAPIPPMNGCNAHLVPEWYGGRIGPTLGQIAAFYDRAAVLLESAETVPAIWPALLAVTEHQRQSGVDPDWKLRLRGHRIAEILHEEPASAWAFRRPRGYPGDAHLIDFVYEHPAVEDELRSATMRGQAIAATISACAASSAVQERRRLLARLLDTTADRVNQARRWCWPAVISARRNCAAHWAGLAGSWRWIRTARASRR